MYLRLKSTARKKRVVDEKGRRKRKTGRKGRSARYYFR
jgi:hypothetical protein